MRPIRVVGKLVLAVSIATSAWLLPLEPARAEVPICDTHAYTKQWCTSCPPEVGWDRCTQSQMFYCANDEPASIASDPWFWCLPGSEWSTKENCPYLGGPEKCNTPVDEDADGCINEGCMIGDPPCTCTGSCNPPVCSPRAKAKCDPYKPNEPEVCGDGEDNNCNDRVDEWCWLGGGGGGSGGGVGGGGGGPKRDGEEDCAAKAGADPILLPSRSALTAPFTDLAVTAVTRLDVTRTYSSADASIVAGAAPGPFGVGWHHDWEAALSCRGNACTVRRGLASGLKYMKTGSAPSLDGAELWDVYTAYEDGTGRYDAPGVLVRRPSGSWTLFLLDGSEQHFRTICDACDAEDQASPRCLDPLSGGSARLVKVVDTAGNAVHLGYDRPAGLLFGLFDDLGHALEVRGAQACATGLATELRYDGWPMVSYEYQGRELMRAADADGHTLRAYAYHAGSGGRLLAVLDEAGTAIAEFAYDASWRATGLVDSESSVTVDYDAPGGVSVTEFFDGPSGPTSSTSLRQLDQSGNVVSVSDGCACGAPRTFQYTDGRMTCRTDAQGHAVAQGFDALGRLTRRAEYGGSCPVPGALPTPSRDERRAYGVVRQIAQGIQLDLDRVTRVTRKSTLSTSGSAEETYDHDPSAKSIDPAGYACTASPLPAGSAVCREIRSGWVTVNGAVVAERHATFFSYDAKGRVTRRVGPVNLDRPSPTDVVPVEERVYWPDDDLLERRGRLRETRGYASPAAAPLVTGFQHDAFGVYQITAPDGAQTTFVKDGRGRVRFALGPDGATETRYHDGANPRLTIGPDGTAVRYSYDGKGRRALVEHLSGDPEAPGATPALAWAEVHVYDAAGNRIRSERRDAAGVVTWRQERAFDVQHRVVRELHPEQPGVWREIVYDGAGFLTGTRDEEGRGTTLVPDVLGRVTTARRTGLDAQGAPVSLDVATYVYQANADVIASLKDAGGQTTFYRQDDFGRLERMAAPAFRGGAPLFTYDARGNLLQRKDTYVTVSYTYDGLDRVLSATATNSVDGSSASYAYVYDEPGGEGRLTTMQDGERSIRFAYDAGGRLASETLTEAGAPPLVTEYRYASGERSEVWYPSGLRIRYVRDAATGDVRAVGNVSDGTRYADGVSRHPGGPVAAMTFGNGLGLDQAFNLRQEPLGVGSGPLSLAYTPSAAGDVGGIADGTASRTFRYDFLDRLTESPGWLAYAYDNNGNRSSETVEGAVAGYYLAGNRVTAKRVPYLASWAFRNAFAYDYQTNVSGIVSYSATGAAQKTMCLRHDALGRLVMAGWAVSNASPDTIACTLDSNVREVLARYRYDARNRRIARWTSSESRWTYVVSDPSGNPLSELALANGAWTRVRDYVWLDGKPLAQIEYPGPAGSTEGYVYYFHVDAIGLPRALTNQAGQTVWSASARPYGDLVETATVDPMSGRTVVTNLRLPGQYDERLLGPVGLQGPYYNWNRWYLPGVGRYLELDPIAKRGRFNTRYGVDWYGYANANPLRYTDRKGLYGTNDCSYYQRRCAESGGKYYCEQAQYWCGWFDTDDPDPDPTRDDDYEGWTRCTRQCLQDCDRDENEDQDSCPPTPDDRKGPWDPRSTSFDCHQYCYQACADWGMGLNDTPPYEPRPYSE